MGGGTGGGVTGGGTGGGATGGGGGGGTGGGATGGGAGGGATGGGAAGYASDVCTAGNPITTDLTLNSQSLTPGTGGQADDYQWTGQPGCTPQGSYGPDTTYSLTIPVGSRVTVTVAPDGPWDPSIQLSDTCSAGTANTCRAGINEALAGQPEVLTYANPGTTPLTTFLIVDTSSATSTAFRLTVAFSTIPAGDVCSTALVANPGTVTGTLGGFANDYSSGPGCASGTNGVDNVWVTSVPAGNRLTSTVTASATQLPDGGTGYGFQPTVNLVVGTCNPTLSCVAGGAAPANGGSATTFFDNVTGGTVPVMVVVDTLTTMPSGSYTLTNSVGVVTLPPGDVCSNVGSPITVDTMLTGETLVGYGSHFSTGTVAQGCRFSDGPDRVYAVTVPPNSRLVASATNATANLAVSVVDGNAAACTASPVVCGASADSTFSGTETSRFDNVTGAAKTVFVIIDRTAATPTVDNFNLAIQLTPAPAFLAGGDSCGSPVTVGANTTVVSTTTGLANDYAVAGSGQCKVGSAAPDSVFQTTIPPNSRFTVTTIASWDMTLNVIAAPMANCGAAGTGTGRVCLASSDGADEIETVTWLNTSAAPLDVFIVIDGWQPNELGTFELTTTTSTLPANPYVKTTIPQACQSLAAPTALLGPATTPPIGDDAVSATTALPFSLTYFGAPMTHFSVNNNGLLQLYASSTGVGVNSYSNVAIPTTATPNGYVSAFWTDMHFATTTTVRYEATGTAPNRKLTVEWFDAVPYPSNRPERMQFQVQFYETTNVIEFHYCSLVANGGSASDITGASATVGIEDQSGDTGLQHSFNTAAAINTTDGLRFTP